ncbi:MAG: hypothetical protein PHI96_05575 [Desulfovibrio sp.]|nr:hypothetical protein [Desulfovibrio sp.]
MEEYQVVGSASAAGLAVVGVPQKAGSSQKKRNKNTRMLDSHANLS